MRIICAQEHPVQISGPSIFLAGPSPRGDADLNWRPEALVQLVKIGFTGTVYIPLPRDEIYLLGYDHDAQVDWELKYLEASDAIAFWVPRDVQKLPGFTTNVEYGLFARSGKIVLGYPPEAQKMRYLQRLANLFDIPSFSTLTETLYGAMCLAIEKAKAHQ